MVFEEAAVEDLVPDVVRPEVESHLVSMTQKQLFRPEPAESDLDYRFGNAAILTLNLSRPVAGRLSASLQGKLFHQTRSLYLTHDVPSTGMTFFYLTPALHVDVRGGVSLYGYLQLPAYRYVNDMQLAPRAAVLTGLSKTF